MSVLGDYVRTNTPFTEARLPGRSRWRRRRAAAAGGSGARGSRTARRDRSTGTPRPLRADRGWYASGAFLFVVTSVGLESSLKSSSRKSSSATVCGLRCTTLGASPVPGRRRLRSARAPRRRRFVPGGVSNPGGFQSPFRSRAARRPTRDASFWRLDRRRARVRVPFVPDRMVPMVGS